MKLPAVLMLVVLGFVAAVCAALLVVFASWHGHPSAAGEARPAPAPEGELTVLVAARPLPAMTVIDEACVRAVKVPKDKAPAGAFAVALQVSGKPLALSMVAGEAFTPSCFAADGSRTKFASTLSKGERAFAINISDHGALDGILYPGSIVDVLTSAKLTNGDPISTTLLSGIEVLAIEKTTIVTPDLSKRIDGAPSTPLNDATGTTGQGGVSGHRVTLQVSEKQAKALQVAMDNGNLALALRNPLDPSGTTGEPVSLASALGLDHAATGQAWEKLAAALIEKWNTARVAAPAPTPGPSATVASSPATQPAAPQWETTVIRGAAKETVHFEISGTGEAPREKQPSGEKIAAR